MSQQYKQAKSIFLDAIERPNDDQRKAFIAAECGDNADLQQEVERLLHNFGDLGSFMKSGSEGSPTLDQPITEKPGTQIGPYKLLQQIGEGGMGVVYMAEQLEPVKRRVALKIIKPGMDTRQVIARFEAERQALSLMDHPNIARVLDAGTTDSGRPYFVMELVKGQPITQYCDEHHLTPRQRLELLLPVCQAIQHAHQKGIIHRDIKPTNILVAEYDQRPVPKVIDFGVAKATSQTLTEKTMFTGYGQIVGTLEYMSPEQAKVNQLDIDTRSDIYSLGVLMYELLTGSTPFDRQRLRSAAFDEMLRIIREEEPPKPSTRLSDLSCPSMLSAHSVSGESSGTRAGSRSEPATLASIAALRQTEPAKLTKLVRGELDWIVMKALEKDRSRRYETASGLAADLQHYLHDEPVVACPPSAAYRLRKFARRNRTSLVIGMIVCVAIIALSIGSSVAAVAFRNLALRNAALATEKEAALVMVTAAEARARQAQQVEAGLRKEAETARNSALLESKRANVTLETIVNMLAMGDPYNERGESSDYTVVEMLLDMGEGLPKELDAQPDIKAEIHAILGRGLTHVSGDQAEHHIKESLRLRTAIYGDKHPKVAESLVTYTNFLWLHKVSNITAESHCRRAIEILRDHPEEKHLMLRAYDQLVKVLGKQNKLAERELAVRDGIEFARRNLAENDPNSVALLRQLALQRLKDGHGEEAESLAARALAINRSRLDPMGMETAWAACVLARIESRRKKYADSESHYREAIELYRKYRQPYLIGHLLGELEPVMRHQERNAEFQKFSLELANEGGVRGLTVLALRKLMSGDAAGYQNDCQQLLELCSNSANLDALETVTFACAFREDALKDWTQATLLAQRLASTSRPSSWNQTTLGAILYRAGQYEQSLDILNHAEELTHDREGKGLGRQYAAVRRWCFLAMANQRAGKSQQARQWHGQVTAALNANRRQKMVGEFFGQFDYESFHLRSLRAEAEDMLGVGEDGEQSLREDIRFLTKQVEVVPSVPSQRELLADSLGRLANLLTVQKQWDDAEQEYRRALALLEELHREFPGEPRYRARIGGVQHGLARALWGANKHEAAVKLLRQSAQVLEKLVSEFQEVREHRLLLANAYRWLALRLNTAADSSEPEGFWRQAIAQFEAVLHSGTLTDQDQRSALWLADSRRRLADVLVAQSRYEEAETAYRKGVELLSSLTAKPFLAAQPNHKALRDGASICYSKLIEFLTSADRNEEAAQVGQSAIRFYEKLAAECPDEPYFGGELTKLQAELAKLKKKE